MVNYYSEFEKIVNNLHNKPKLLLHSCCAPCSSSVLEKLNKYFNITVFFYNPNIVPFDEYERRLKEQVNLLEKLKINYIIGEYDNQQYLRDISDCKNLGEGSLKCKKCYYLRMRQTAILAVQNNFEYFTTTLSVSPYKNAVWINEIGDSLQKEFNVKFLFSDFKKKNGYLRSLQLSKEYGLYRQNYCGCTPVKENNESKNNTK